MWLVATIMDRMALGCIFQEGKDLCLMCMLLLSQMLAKVLETQTMLSNIWLMVNK